VNRTEELIYSLNETINFNLNGIILIIFLKLILMIISLGIFSILIRNIEDIVILENATITIPCSMLIYQYIVLI